MRIRSIKPDFWKSDDTASLKDWNDRLVFVGLWSYVDDNGVGRDNERLITSELFPLEDDPREASVRVRRALAHIADRKLIVRYEGENGVRLLHVTGWHHQKIDRPSKARFPLPTCGNGAFDEGSTNTLRGSAEGSLRARKDQGSGIRDQGAEEQGETHCAPPERDEDDEPHPKLPRRKDVVVNDPHPGFAEFYTTWPVKRARPDAAWAYEKAIANVPPNIINAAAKRFASDPNLPGDQSLIPYPATWLNREGWTESPLPARGSVNGHRTSTTDQRVSDGIDLARRLAAKEQQQERAHTLEIEAGQ